MVFWNTARDHVFLDLGDKYQKLLNQEKTAAAELQVFATATGAAG
jgi:hypothetical protein